MKRVLIAGLLVLLPAVGRCEEQLVDRVVAVVNNDVITQSELSALFQPIIDQLQEAYHGEELAAKLRETRLKLLSQLIEDRLVLMEAKKLGIEVTEEEISERLEQFKQQFESESAFDNALKAQQITSAMMRKRIGEQIAIQKLHYVEVKQKVIISPLEIKSYYDSHPDQFSQKEKVEAWSITIRKNNDAVRKGLTDEAAKKKIESILSDLKKGREFDDAAKKESQDAHAHEGGHIGFVARGDLIDAIDQALFALAPGDLSGVLETEQAYHIFKAGTHEPPRTLTLDEARDKIHDFLYRNKANARFEEWMKELKKTAYISIL